MGSVASLRLPQGFCFSTPNQTHDQLLAFLSVLATSSSTIFYSQAEPTDTSEATINSIWVKTPANSSSNHLEMYFYIKKHSSATTSSWCKYYPYSIGDIDLSVDTFTDSNEAETARAGFLNNRPFAVCDGGTYGGVTTPNLTGRILFGGYANNPSTPSSTTAQIMQTLKDTAPSASATDLSTTSNQLAVTALKPLRQYFENGNPTTSAAAPILDPQTSVTNFMVHGTYRTVSSLFGARKVILKRDQVPNHNHKYGWETWATRANCVFGGGGSAALSTRVTATTATTNTYATGTSTAKTLGRAHDNLPPVVAATYRMYIGYGT
jgi:microcystin-dependent protein